MALEENVEKNMYVMPRFLFVGIWIIERAIESSNHSLNFSYDELEVFNSSSIAPPIPSILHCRE
jgi:hypothetical protein